MCIVPARDAERMNQLEETPNESGMSAPSFESEARAAFGRFRGALAGLFAALPSGVRTATDVQRAFNVDSKTGWRLHRIGTSLDPLAVGVHLPGKTLIDRALRAAEKHGVAKPIIDAVDSAFAEIEGLIEKYAGDRTTFDSMVSAFATDPADQVDLHHRRAAFRANSHLLGVQSRASILTHILHPNAQDPKKSDLVLLSGSYDKRLLRADARFDSVKVDTYAGRDPSGDVPEPLGDHPSGFLPQFSSGPSPIQSYSTRGRGHAEYAAGGTAVGIPSSTTRIFGNMVRGVGPPDEEGHSGYHRMAASVVNPAELVFMNVLMHRRIFDRRPVSTFILMGKQVDISADPRDYPPSWHLPVRNPAEFIGSGLAAVHTPELPRYTELVTWTLGKVGWDPDVFDVYRIRVEYPVLYSHLIVEFELLPPSARTA